MNLFGVPVSPAFMVKLQQQATAALTPCYEELNAALPDTTVVNCDETPTKEGSKKAWIWVAAAPLFTVFAIALTRAASVIENLLGTTYHGVMSSDRDAGDNAYNRQRQLCWAHLKRDFQALVDAGGKAPKVGQKLLSYLHFVFDHWQDYVGGKISRATLKRRIDRDVIGPMWQTIATGREATRGPTRALCRDLFKRWPQLWRFLD
jgi:transposase